MDLTNIKTIREILERSDLKALKRFGQNFLTNGSILEKMISAAEITKNDHVIEIGPGLGVLTKELALNAGKVTTIELDKFLIPILKENLSDYSNIEILNIDALTFTPPKEKYKVVANIPYNITSPLLNHFLKAENKPISITFLVQKEVADKICKSENNESILSLQVKLFGHPKIIAKVSKNSFYPAPKVDSAILHIKIYEKTDSSYISDEDALKILEIAKKAFSGKRKMLSTTLKSMRPTLEKLDLSTSRPQELSIKDWQNLADRNAE